MPTATLEPTRLGSYGSGAIDRAVDHIQQAGPGHSHRAVYAAACGLAELAAGGELTDAQIDRARALLMATGTAARHGDQAEVRRTIDAAWRKGSTQPRTAPTDGRALRDRVDAIEAISSWWAAVTSVAAPDNRWATTLKILAGLALEGVAGGCTYVSVSHRQLAETAGVSAGTITKHRAALAPWANLVETGDQAQALASRWYLIIHRASGNIPAHAGEGAPQVFPSVHPLLAPSHNLWHRWAGGWSTLLSLASQDSPTATDALAHQVGRSPRSMLRILGRLAQLGLVERHGDAWTATLEEITETVSDELHNAGIDHQAARRARHQAQRALWEASPVRKNWLYARQARERRALQHQDQYHWTTDDDGNLVPALPNGEAA